MNELYPLFDVNQEAQLSLPLKNINLHDWFSRRFSTTDYRHAAKGHWAMGSSFNSKNQAMLINVESIGGHLMVQNYIAETSEKEHLRFVSDATDFWLFHLVHIHLRVVTDLKVLAMDQNSSILVCRITCEMPDPIIAFLSKLIFTQYFVKKHCLEETRSFATYLSQMA